MSTMKRFAKGALLQTKRTLRDLSGYDNSGNPISYKGTVPYETEAKVVSDTGGDTIRVRLDYLPFRNGFCDVKRTDLECAD